MKKNILLIFILAISVVIGCGGRKFKKTPVDNFIQQFQNDSSFSIILYDMDEQGTFFSKYLHKYRIIRETSSGLSDETTDWYEVDKRFFNAQIENLGMVIVSKSNDGKINKVASPPGYSNYVGNQRYGYWNNSGGGSFWVFYGQYALMRDIFGFGSYPAYRTSYNTYDNRYRGRSPYYGPRTSTGKNTYGTRSNFAKKTNPRSTWNQKVNQRASRSGSRYNSRSSSRSRGGGFGK